MKRFLLSLSLFIFTAWAAAQSPGPGEFILSGEIKDCPKKVVYFSYKDKSGNQVKDSCLLQNGHFSFKGRISEPTFSFIKTNTEIIPDDQNKNIPSIFLERVPMTVKAVHDHFDEMIVTGSKTHDEYSVFEKKGKEINKKYTDSLYERHSRHYENFIFNHRDSYVSAYLLSMVRSRWPQNTVEYLYGRLNDQIQNGSNGKGIKAYLDGLDANSEGRKANDFTAKEVGGKTIKLANFKGKYVLLDFWGSWCVPCRESSPHLIELFKKYTAKGFEIIGVSTEYEKTDTKWREAIKKDGTGIWHNVLSTPMEGTGGGFTKEIADMFGVHVFPTKILVDPCGYIIGRFQGTGEDVKLDEKLKEVFK